MRIHRPLNMNARRCRSRPCPPLRPRKRRNWSSSNVCRKPWRTPATSPSCGRPRRTCGATWNSSPRSSRVPPISPTSPSGWPGRRPSSIQPCRVGQSTPRRWRCSSRPNRPGVPARSRTWARTMCCSFSIAPTAPTAMPLRRPWLPFRRATASRSSPSAWTAVRCRASPRRARTTASPPP